MLLSMLLSDIKISFFLLILSLPPKHELEYKSSNEAQVDQLSNAHDELVQIIVVWAIGAIHTIDHINLSGSIDTVTIIANLS